LKGAESYRKIKSYVSHHQTVAFSYVNVLESPESMTTEWLKLSCVEGLP